MLEPHSIWMEKNNHKKIFTSWPGLSSDLVQKYLTKKQPTILGNLQKPRKGLQSTQEKVLQLEPEPEPHLEQDQFTPSMQSDDTNIVFLKKVDLTGKYYTDQTGRSPVTSNKINKYILVAYHYDSNNIHAEPLKTRSVLYLKTDYHKIHSLLTNKVLKPRIHILDNECPNVLKIFMKEVNEKFQLVPPHINHRNSEERAIRTFKKISFLD